MQSFDIIIPIYNAYNSLDRCLKSLLEQTYSRFNVWMVDDGSVDESPCICKEYVEADHRFHYIRQENAGPSAARNNALENVAADYVVFIDSDDYVYKDYLELLLLKYQENNVDAVFIGYEEVDSLGNVITRHVLEEDFTEKGMMQLVELLYRNNMFGNTWLKSFKCSCIKSVRFKEGMHLFEDELFTCQVLSECSSISVVNLPVYRYVIDTSTALTKRTYQDYCLYRNFVFEAWKTLLDAKNVDAKEFLQHLADTAYNTCKYYFYEHSLDDVSFLESFANASFLPYVSVQETFKNKLLRRQFNKIVMLKMQYLAKIKIVGWLKKND